MHFPITHMVYKLYLGHGICWFSRRWWWHVYNVSSPCRRHLSSVYYDRVGNQATKLDDRGWCFPLMTLILMCPIASYVILFRMFSSFTTFTWCFRLWTIIIEYWIFDSDECDICNVLYIWYAKAIPKGADNCAWLVVLVFGAIDDHLYFGVIV